MASYPASSPVPYRAGTVEYPPRESGATAKIVAVFLGIAVSILAIVSVVLMQAADAARDEARAAGDASAAAEHEHAAPGGGNGAAATPLQSYAGQTAENAEELAQAHEPYDAKLPPLQPGNVVNVKMVVKDDSGSRVEERSVRIRPGERFVVKW